MDDPTSWTDSRLAQLLDRLCTAYRLNHRLQARVDEDDLKQEVLFRVIQAGAPEGRPLAVWESYLRQAFESATTDLHRRHTADKRDLGREVREGDLSPGHSADSTPQLGAVLPGDDTRPSVAAMRNEIEERLQAALKRLPDAQREAFLMHRAGHGPTEIGKVMGVTPDAVSSLIRRATLAVQHVVT